MVVSAIRAAFREVLEVIGAEAGMHRVALMPRGVNDVAVSKAAAEAGISLIPLSSCHARKTPRGGLILGYGGATKEQIQEGIRKLKACIERTTVGQCMYNPQRRVDTDDLESF